MQMMEDKREDSGFLFSEDIKRAAVELSAKYEFP